MIFWRSSIVQVFIFPPLFPLRFCFLSLFVFWVVFEISLSRLSDFESVSSLILCKKFFKLIAEMWLGLDATFDHFLSFAYVCHHREDASWTILSLLEKMWFHGLCHYLSSSLQSFSTMIGSRSKNFHKVRNADHHLFAYFFGLVFLVFSFVFFYILLDWTDQFFRSFITSSSFPHFFVNNWPSTLAGMIVFLCSSFLIDLGDVPKGFLFSSLDWFFEGFWRK